VRGERVTEGCSGCWGETHHHPDSTVTKTTLGVKLTSAPLKESGLIIGSWPTVSSPSSGGGSKQPRWTTILSPPKPTSPLPHLQNHLMLQQFHPTHNISIWFQEQRLDNVDVSSVCVNHTYTLSTTKYSEPAYRMKLMLTSLKAFQFYPCTKHRIMTRNRKMSDPFRKCPKPY